MADRLPELPAGAFDKVDGGGDSAIHAPARLVTHSDEASSGRIRAGPADPVE